MNKYIVSNEQEFKNVIEQILKKDRGAFIDHTGSADKTLHFPVTITSNVKIKVKT